MSWWPHTIHTLATGHDNPSARENLIDDDFFSTTVFSSRVSMVMEKCMETRVEASLSSRTERPRAVRMRRQDRVVSSSSSLSKLIQSGQHGI